MTLGRKSAGYHETERRGDLLCMGSDVCKALCWEEFEEGKEIRCGKDLAQIQSILKTSMKDDDSRHPTFFPVGQTL